MSPPTASMSSAIERALRVGRPLEQQVLEEVRDPRLRVGLVARPVPTQNADARRAHAEHALGDEPDAAIERRDRRHGRIVGRPATAGGGDQRRGPPRRRGPRFARGSPLAAGHARAEVAEVVLDLGGELVLERDALETIARFGGARRRAGAAVVRACPTGRAGGVVRRHPRGLAGRRSARRPRRRARARPCPAGRCRRTTTSTGWPSSRTSSTRSTRLPPPRREMWSRPSRPGRMLTNAPNLVMFTTLPG